MPLLLAAQAEQTRQQIPNALPSASPIRTTKPQAVSMRRSLGDDNMCMPKLRKRLQGTHLRGWFRVPARCTPDKALQGLGMYKRPRLMPVSGIEHYRDPRWTMSRAWVAFIKRPASCACQRDVQKKATMSWQVYQSNATATSLPTATSVFQINSFGLP